MDDARETAIAKLAELLKHPDDLTTKVGPLKRRLAKEKASIEAQLNAGVQSQLDSVQGGLETLNHSVNDIDNVKSDLRAIDNLCVNAQSMISDFPTISKISRVHQNFVATQEKIVAFDKLAQQLDELEDLIRPMKEDLLQAGDDLLHVHYHLFKLEEFRDHAMHQARDSSRDVILTLEKYFRRVEVLSEDFKNYLWEIARNLFQVVDKGYGSMVVKLIKIIECEELADSKALAAREAQETHKDLSGHKHWRLAEGNPRTIKSYRVDFFDQLHQLIFERFEQQLAESKEEQKWDDALVKIKFVFEDLEFVYDDIVPKFPKKYKIFPYFVLEYHRHTYDLLSLVMAQEELMPGDILGLLCFVRNYYATMSTQLGVTEELLEPRLLDGQESALADNYIGMTRKTTDQWVSRIRSLQTEEFLTRKDASGSDEPDKFVLTGSVDLFLMMNQQIDAAKTANQGQLLYLVALEGYKVIKGLHSYWKQLLSEELSKQLVGDDSGFLESAIALANDQYECIERTENFFVRVVEFIDAKYKNQIEENMIDAMDGYEHIAHSACEALLDIVFKDTTQIFDILFMPDWYLDKNEKKVNLLVGTFQDYTKDFEPTIISELFVDLMKKMLDRLLTQYLKAMRHKHAEFRSEAAAKIGKEKKLFYQFFEPYLDRKYLLEEFNVLDRVHGLISSGRSMIFVDYYDLRKDYPDVPLAFVESILSKRKDLDRSALKDIIEGIKAKARDIEPDTGAPPTIFSRIKW